MIGLKSQAKARPTGMIFLGNRLKRPHPLEFSIPIQEAFSRVCNSIRFGMETRWKDETTAAVKQDVDAPTARLVENMREPG
jgi:hypothetical protein